MNIKGNVHRSGLESDQVETILPMWLSDKKQC